MSVELIQSLRPRPRSQDMSDLCLATLKARLQHEELAVFTWCGTPVPSFSRYLRAAQAELAVLSREQLEARRACASLQLEAGPDIEVMGLAAKPFARPPRRGTSP